MPWGRTCVMDERMSFIVDWRDGVMGSFAELCRYYGVSRRTGYKLVERYELEGVAGLEDRSRAPHHHPNALSEEVEAVILALKAKFPTYGPKKLQAELKARRADLRPPAVSTIAALLARHGLTRRKRVRRRVPPHPLPLSACAAANDVWGVDFKGWFVLGNGTRCEPLSLSDLTTRFVLRLQAVKRTDTAHVWPILDAAFREFGPPLVMRSDNGPPFAGTGAGGLSQLAVRLIKVGVLPDSENRWMNPDMKLYQTTVAIEGTRDWLKPGMSAKIEIMVKRLDDVVYVPLQAVSLRDGKQVVFRSGRTKPVEVETGDFTDEFIEIRKGLDAGDTVLLRAPEEDKSGGEKPKSEEAVPATEPAKQTASR